MPTKATLGSHLCTSVRDNGATSSTTVDETATKTWTQNSGWRKKIRLGIQAGTFFDASQKRVIEDTPGYYELRRYNIVTKVSQVGFWKGSRFSSNSIANPDNYSLSNVENAAKSEFNRKALAVERSFESGVALGELRETLHMIRHPAAAIMRLKHSYLSAVKKRYPKVLKTRGGLRGEAREHAIRRSMNNMIQDTWLEYSFGWVPLYNDVADAAKALAKSRYQDYPVRQYIQGRAVEEFSAGTSVLGPFAHATGLVYGKSHTDVRLEVRYYGIVTSKPHWSGPVAQFGLLPRDFVPTVWELIPYSFLVDYFLNVGDILDGFAAQTCNIAWAMESIRKQATKVACEDRQVMSSALNFVETGQVNVPGRFVLQWRFFQRHGVDETSFVPSLTFTIPGFKSKKWWNVGALFARSRRSQYEINSSIRRSVSAAGTRYQT